MHYDVMHYDDVIIKKKQRVTMCLYISHKNLPYN